MTLTEPPRPPNAAFFTVDYDRALGKPAQAIKQIGGSGRFDWEKVPVDKLRQLQDVLRLAQRDGIVIDHE